MRNSPYRIGYQHGRSDARGGWVLTMYVDDIAKLLRRAGAPTDDEAVRRFRAGYEKGWSDTIVELERRTGRPWRTDPYVVV